MKFVLLLAVCFVAAVSATDVKQHDFREELDQILAEWAHDKVKEAEHYLEHVIHEVEEFKKKPTKVEQERILNELQGTIGIVEGMHHYFETETKRTDLNALERYIFESGKLSSEVLVNDLKNVEKEVKSIHVQ